MIEGVSTDATDYSLAIGALPGRPGSNLYLFNTQVLDPGWEGSAIDRVIIPQQVTGCSIPRECLDDLLGSPLGGRVFGNIEVHDPSALVIQHDEDEKNPALDRGDGEKVTRHDIARMIGQKRFPVGRRRLRDSWSILLDGGFGHDDVQLSELADNAR